MPSLHIPGFGKADKTVDETAVVDETVEGVAEGADEPSSSIAISFDRKPTVPPNTELEADNAALDQEMEDIKQALVELKRDLVILEEELLFPASSQVAVFLSMDVGEFFSLDAVTLKLNGKQVAHHLYTERETDALYRGGVQRLFVGNVKQGANDVTAFFTGRGPSGRDYRRATSIAFEKSFEPVFVELKISDSTAKYQPEFEANLSE